jgi:protein-disulfide isomerase
MIVHPQVVTDAHKAGCAAAKQQKFVPFKDAVWEKAFIPYQAGHDPSKLGLDNLLVIAKDLGLDTARLKADMESPECQAQIAKDMEELAKFHVNATPTFFINGQHVGGALPKEGFKKIIDERLRIAEASGVAGADYYEKEVMGKGEKQFRSKLDPKPN